MSSLCGLPIRVPTLPVESMIAQEMLPDLRDGARHALNSLQRPKDLKRKHSELRVDEKDI